MAKLPLRRRVARVVAGAVLVALAGAAPVRATPTDPCTALAGEVERVEGIPPGLVQAVALAESGRWFADDRRSRPWPWTVTSGSESHFLPSKAAALAKVREWQAAGRTNIDVGCMQVNLGYHGHAFRTLEEAFDPAHNVTYGARFLKRLRLETRSWSRATARYHSRDPDRGQAYRAKVFRLWREVQEGRGEWPQVTLMGPRPAQDDDGPTHAEASGGTRLWTPGSERPPLPAKHGEVAILRGR